jgi:hypothetical protein
MEQDIVYESKTYQTRKTNNDTETKNFEIVEQNDISSPAS